MAACGIQQCIARPAGNLELLHSSSVAGWDDVDNVTGRCAGCGPDLLRTCRKLAATRPHTCCSSERGNVAWVQAAGRHADTCIIGDDLTAAAMLASPWLYYLAQLWPVVWIEDNAAPAEQSRLEVIKPGSATVCAASSCQEAIPGLSYRMPACQW